MKPLKETYETSDESLFAGSSIYIYLDNTLLNTREFSYNYTEKIQVKLDFCNYRVIEPSYLNSSPKNLKVLSLNQYGKGFCIVDMNIESTSIKGSMFFPSNNINFSIEYTGTCNRFLKRLTEEDKEVIYQ